MKNLAKIVNWIVSRRYDINIIGEDVICDATPKIFIPNHQAEVDPIVLLSVLQKKHKAAPMISAAYYNVPIFKQILDLVDSVPVSDLDKGVRDANVMNTIRDSAINAFNKGDSILLYPAGHLCNQGFEIVGNKQSVYNILESAPDNLQVLGVRMSGFWGSMWSRAWIGVSPAFTITLLKSIMVLIVNLVFFVPKRKVVFEFFDITKEAKEKAKVLKRREFNEYLEKLYNKNGEEKIRYIRYHFLAPKLVRKIPKEIKGVINDRSEEIEFIKIK
ncbi:MAG: 1-acyl-sn-glycerol-3-phosphate acyltransferase [Bacteroidales bacterium]|nr:1-acyl-sn-glycerol-3-phosphate acyltransferase [Bacteroidales bacterium]